MKIATKIRCAKDVGFQLILDDSYLVIGVNLLCNKKILLKKRFDKAIHIKSQLEETALVNQVFCECFPQIRK